MYLLPTVFRGEGKLIKNM